MDQSQPGQIRPPHPRKNGNALSLDREPQKDSPTTIAFIAEVMAAVKPRSLPGP